MCTCHTLSWKSVHSFTVDRRAKRNILGRTTLKCDSIIVWSAVKPHSNFTAITMTECYLILDFLNIYISKYFTNISSFLSYIMCEMNIHISWKIFTGEIRYININYHNECKNLVDVIWEIYSGTKLHLDILLKLWLWKGRYWYHSSGSKDLGFQFY